jgi:hypothetical protein
MRPWRSTKLRMDCDVRRPPPCGWSSDWMACCSSLMAVKAFHCTLRIDLQPDLQGLIQGKRRAAARRRSIVLPLQLPIIPVVGELGLAV